MKTLIGRAQHAAPLQRIWNQGRHGGLPLRRTVPGLGEGVLPYAPTFRAHTQVRPYSGSKLIRLLRCARNDNGVRTGAARRAPTASPSPWPSPAGGEGSPV